MHESTLPCSEQTFPVFPLEAATVPRSISPEPQCVGGESQASGVPLTTSQVPNECSSGIPGAPDTLLALPAGQASSVPGLLMPLIPPQFQVEGPEGTHCRDTYQASNEIFLEEVLPEKGPTTGGIKIAILGENFPSTPLYVGFGDSWVRAVSKHLTLLFIINPKTYGRRGATPIHCDAIFLHLLRLVL